jgi:hypothetical protein
MRHRILSVLRIPAAWRGIPGRILLRLRRLVTELWSPRPASLRYLGHLACLRRHESALARQFGTLAREAGLDRRPEAARRFAEQAYRHWTRARRAEARLVLPSGDPRREAAL